MSFMDGWTLKDVLTCCFFHRGVLVPGGFGVRGTEGKMLAINWARKQNKPYLGERLLKWVQEPRTL